MTFGEKLKAGRVRLNLSQEQLAEKLYVSRQAVTKWETDKGMPSLASLQDIAKLFGVSVDELLDQDSENGEQQLGRTMRETIDLSEYGKPGRRANKAVLARFPQAEQIYPLLRRKKFNKWEVILDWAILVLFAPNIVRIVDSLSDLSPYYLVEQGEQQLLVKVEKTFIERTILLEKFSGKRLLIDGNYFTKLKGLL